MSSRDHGTCPVHADFDPLSNEFLTNPFAVMAPISHETPVFYAPAIDYYVVTRYADIKAIFLDPETYSAIVTQLPLAQIVPEAAQILMGSGYRPQPSMVSLDPPSHTRFSTFAARICQSPSLSDSAFIIASALRLASWRHDLRWKP